MNNNGFNQLFCTFSLFIAAISTIFSQTIPLNKDKQEVEIVQASNKRLLFQFNINEINAEIVNLADNQFVKLNFKGSYPDGALGYPNLPAFKKLIEIPNTGNIVINVISSKSATYKLDDYDIKYKIEPVQQSLRKDKHPDSSKFNINEEVYQAKSFIAKELVTVDKLGTLRGTEIAQLVIAPVQYNPVENSINVYYEIELAIDFKGHNEKNTIKTKSKTYSPYFNIINDKLFSRLHYPNHPDLTKYPVKYLIVSDRMFEATLQPFIQWKTQQGFKVITAYTDTIGAAYADIQAYIHAQYLDSTTNEPAPSFLLLVGDAPQIPLIRGSASNKFTDLYYASVDGDMFPEMYYGRLSATNTSQLQAQIDKILYYEKYLFAEPEYLNTITLIAGADNPCNGTHGQPTVLYGKNYFFTPANGIDSVNLYLNSYTGCYNTVNQGVGLINYTAHGSRTSWSNPGLSQTQVNAFTNSNKFPIAIGNCCLAADFGLSDECFGETWMRKANGGAVGYIGSSPNSYWDEDVYWAVGAFPTVGNGIAPTPDQTTLGVYESPWSGDYVCLDAHVFVGNLAVTEAIGNNYSHDVSALYYWQAYNCLGDPSLIPYYGQGKVQIISHNSFIQPKTNSFSVAALAGSYVALSKDNVLHGVGLVDSSGQINMTIVPFEDTCTALLVVTKPHYQPVIKSIRIEEPNNIAEQIFDGIINPNPAKDAFSYTFNIAENKAISIKLYSSNGLLVSNRANVPFARGNNTITFHTDALSAGLYYLVLQYDDKLIKHKIIITH